MLYSIGIEFSEELCELWFFSNEGNIEVDFQEIIDKMLMKYVYSAKLTTLEELCIRSHAFYYPFLLKVSPAKSNG